MKKLIAYCLIVLIAATAASGHATSQGDYTYHVHEDGTAEITAYTGSEKSLRVPEQLGGHPVTAIGYAAFQGNRKLTAVMLPDSLTTIHASAFADCANLTAIQLPEGLLRLEGEAFSGCRNLVVVALPMSLETIVDNPFAGIDPTISVPKGHPRFAVVEGVLFDVPDRRLVHFPIGNHITEYVVPEDILEIGGGAFWHHPTICAVSLPQGLLSIGNYAFHSCEWLEYLVLPEGLQTIGVGAFFDCVSLEEVWLPLSLQWIGMDAFNYPTTVLIAEGSAAEEWARTSPGAAYTYTGEVVTPAPATAAPQTATFYLPTSEDGWIYQLLDDGTASLRGFESDLIGDTAIPGTVDGYTVTRISDGAFFQEYDLTSLTFPASLRVVEACAFTYCDSLRTLHFPEGTERIESYAFGDCPLETVYLPNSLVFIGEDVFNDPYHLTLVVPEGSFAARFAANNGIKHTFAEEP